MSTIGRALRTVITGTNIVGERVFRDLGPEDEPLPIVTFNEQISQNVPLRGDGARPLAYRRLVQVSLFQKADDEDDSLISTLISALDAATLSDTTEHVLGCTLVDCQRLYEEQDEIVQHAITLQVTYTQ